MESRGTAGYQRTYWHQLRMACGRQYGFARQDGVHGLCVKGKKEPVVVFELLARRGCLSAEQHRVIKTYLEGLEAYKHGDFKTAAAQFEAALSLDPRDGPSRVYLERANEYLVAPPPPDWDGVYELKSK